LYLYKLAIVKKSLHLLMKK